MTNDDDIEKALQVIVKTRHIRRFLRDHDPMALEQAERALGMEPGLHPDFRRSLKGIVTLAEDAVEEAAKRDPDYERVVDLMDDIEERMAKVRDDVGDILWRARLEDHVS